MYYTAQFQICNASRFRINDKLCLLGRNPGHHSNNVVSYGPLWLLQDKNVL